MPTQEETIERIKEFELMKDGWYEGFEDGLLSKAPNKEGLKWLALNMIYFTDLEGDDCFPYIYPDVEGGVQLEMDINGNCISIEIDLEKYSGYFHCLKLDTNEDFYYNVDLNKKEDWNKIINDIKKVGEGEN